MSLDVEAWQRWEAYRLAIRKPIKPASAEAMKLKLARYGDDQAAVVEQSISNQWQGLFELKKSKPGFGEKPVKTDKQVAADNERWQHAQDRNAREWDKRLGEPLAKLKLADALLARYNVRNDELGHDERMEWLRERVADLLRESDAKLVAGDPSLLAMIRQFWSEKGVLKIRARAAAVAA
jgi:hypothetical protein